MNAILFDEFSYANRDEWLASRDLPFSFRVGASEIGGLVGCGYATQTPYTLYLQKVKRLRVDAGNQFGMNIGTWAEPLVRKAFEAKTRLRLQQGDGKHVIRVSKPWPWMIATLDDYVIDRGECAPVELKYLGFQQSRDFRQDELPLKYTVQLQFQMAVTGWNFGYIAALIGTELQVRRIDRHEKLIEQLVRVSKEFVDLCEAGTPPPVDDSEATAKALGLNYREYGSDETATELSVDVAEDAMMLEQMESDYKSLGKKIDLIKNRVRQEIGDATYGYAPDGTTWRWKKTKSGSRTLTRCAKPPRVVMQKLAASCGEEFADEYEFEEFTEIGD